MSFEAATDTPTSPPATGSRLIGMGPGPARVPDTFELSDFLAKAAGGHYLAGSARIGFGTGAPLAPVHIAATQPVFMMDATGAEADEKRWRFFCNNKSIYLQAVDDANAIAAGAYIVDRGTGTTIDKHRWLTSVNVERLRLTNAGVLQPGADNAQPLGAGSLRWSVVYAGTGTINTSDERLKDLITEVPDAHLDAWGDVRWRRFKYRDAMAEKDAAARWHIGLIAQHIHAAFAARGLDAFGLGLLCHDAWAEEREPIYATGVDEDGNEINVPTGETRVTLEAGDRWSLRYEECLALEAAWQRRRGDRLEAAIAAIEDRLAAADIA